MIPGTTPLLTSIEQKMIGNRFLVKPSTMDNGVNPKSIMVAVLDLLEKGFTIKFFKKEDDVADFLKLLQAASK